MEIARDYYPTDKTGWGGNLKLEFWPSPKHSHRFRYFFINRFARNITSIYSLFENNRKIHYMYIRNQSANVSLSWGQKFISLSVGRRGAREGANRRVGKQSKREKRKESNRETERSVKGRSRRPMKSSVEFTRVHVAGSWFLHASPCM